MKHFRSEELSKLIAKLPSLVAKKLERQFTTLKQNEHHHSLHLKKVGSYWSFSIDLSYRAIGKELSEGVLWFWVGTHDEYERVIRRG